MNQNDRQAKPEEGQGKQTSSQVASDYIAQDTQDPIPTSRPSQAEGDRETIEEDIAEKEAEGEL